MNEIQIDYELGDNVIEVVKVNSKVGRVYLHQVLIIDEEKIKFQCPFCSSSFHIHLTQKIKILFKQLSFFFKNLN